MNDDVQLAASRGRAFLVGEGAALEAAVVDRIWFDGDPQAIVDGLSRYQNDDGGFGKGLEVDIGAPQSNPFADCLALDYLRGVPSDVGVSMRAGLGEWLVENQAEDGDWHFSAETKAGKLAPWFAEWSFPSLNPACCLAGLAAVNGLATDEMLARVRALFDEQASLVPFAMVSSMTSRRTPSTRSQARCRPNTWTNSPQRSFAGRARTDSKTTTSSTLRCGTRPSSRHAFRATSSSLTLRAHSRNSCLTAGGPHRTTPHGDPPRRPEFCGDLPSPRRSS